MSTEDASRELVDRALAGDAAAMQELLEHHLPSLRAFLRLRMSPELRAKESCSDLAQSACRDVLEHLDRFQYHGEGNFRHWLYTTALRKVMKRYEYYKAAKRDLGREVTPAVDASGDEPLAQLYQTLSTPSQALMRREQVERFEAAFEQLPEHYREIITLSRIVGLSHKEIAEQQGKSETATRSLLHRALAELTEVLERMEQGDSQ